MNKKFLSAILFGALMVTSTGTFVSCKDYDDDIDEINKELDDIKSQLTDLQTKIGTGKFVTNVSKEGEGIIITWNDNTTNKIETIKGDKVEITIDPVTKNWLIDGKDTGVCAEGKNGTSGNGINAKSPSIDATTGNWIVYEWDGEAQEYVGTDTGISAKGASAYVVDDGNYYTLNVAADKAGSSYTTIKLPKSPVVITEIEILGTCLKGNLTSIENGTINYDRVLVGSLNDAQKKWNKEEGVKQIKEKQVMSSLDNTNLMVRVAPATLDAGQLSFALINSKMKEAPITLGTPEAYDGLLTRATVSGNGLWTIPTAAKEGEIYNNLEAYDANFKSGGKKIAFALKEADNFVTNYDLAFEYKQETLTTAVAKINSVVVAGSKTTARDNATLQSLDESALNKVNIGEVAITFDAPANVYDAHLHFDDATLERFGIIYGGNGTTFQVTKRADDITAANFQVQVHYVVLREASAPAVVKSEYLPFRVMKSYANVTELGAKDIFISATEANNAVSFDLAPMYDDLSNITLWKADVTNSELVLYEVTDAAPGYKEITAGAEAVLTGGTALNNRTGVKVQITNAGAALDPAKEYFYMVTYTDASGDVLNQVKVPFTISLPTLDKLFVEQEGVFNHETHTAAAWLDGKRNASTAIAASYNFTSAFNKLATTLGTTTFNVELDNATEIVKVDGAKKTSADLAQFNGNVTSLSSQSSSNVAGWTISLNANIGVDSKTNTPAGYGKDLIVKIKNINYLNKYNMGDASYTFKVNVKSPLLEGKVVAINGEVTVPATALDGYQVNSSHIEGYTYNDIKYSIFKDQVANPSPWKRKEIKTVEFSSEDTNIFTCAQYSSDFTSATDDAAAKDGYVVVTPKNIDYTTSANMTVKVTDAWGYVLTQTIKVTVTKGE